MQQELAQRLLSKTLEWSEEEIEKYRELLDDLSELKYDQYQQYKPSSRFVENLCIWLNQFDTNHERELALNFILNNLVFISPAEMQHLVNTVYPELVLPFLENQAKTLINENCGELGMAENVTKIVSRQSLFLAMSDGARIDVFRRFSKLDHDQVCVSYDLSDTKFDEIINEMKERTKELSSKMSLPTDYLSDTFRNVFLLDDFSGSGISYLRRENGKWKGKIDKVLNHLKKEKILGSSKDTKPEIHIIIYLITEQAYQALQKNLAEYCKGKNYSIHVHYLQKIERVELTDEQEAWLKKYYISSIVEDSHYKKGNMDNPHHGFDGCSLALVLYHNTPNNSLPILWAGENALFPRVTRHKDVRE